MVNQDKDKISQAPAYQGQGQGNISSSEVQEIKKPKRFQIERIITFPYQGRIKRIGTI